MQFYYGDKMLLRVLDETQFWKRQETEHTVVIRQLVDNLEMEYVSLLQEWEQAFAQAEGTAVKYIETVIRSGKVINVVLEQQIIQFISLAIKQSQQFIILLNRLASASEAVRNNTTAIVVINHIRRESEYYIGIAQIIIDSQKNVSSSVLNIKSKEQK